MIDLNEIYIPKTENLLFENPINPGDELYYYMGRKEIFYLIDFFGVKENSYYISNYGRVFSLLKRKQLEGIYVPDEIGNCYFRVSLTMRDGGLKTMSVHRLVAMAFLPKSINDFQKSRDIVNHKDYIKSNNVMWNLEWMSNQENVNYSVGHQITKDMFLVTFDRTSQDPNKRQFGETRLTETEVHLICKALEDGSSYDQCCQFARIKNTPANKTIICNIAAGRRWQEISSQYNIQREMRKMTDLSSYIIPVCELLQEGKMNIKQIVQYLNIPGSYDSARMFVSSIKNRKTYTNISKDYSF